MRLNCRIIGERVASAIEPRCRVATNREKKMDITTQQQAESEPGQSPEVGAQLVLGMDAATPPASVALVRGDEELACRTGPFGPKTDAWILAAVEEVLRETGIGFADLDCIAAGCGPGTFTGIRVGLAAALGLAAGSGVQVCGIGSLDALAEGAQAATGRIEPLDVLALVDARRQQHYALRAIVEPAPARIVAIRGPEAIGTEELIASLAENPPGVSVGATVELPDGVRRLDGPPLAVSIARLAARMSTDKRPPAVPSYLRPPDAVPGVSPLRRRSL